MKTLNSLITNILLVGFTNCGDKQTEAQQVRNVEEITKMVIKHIPQLNNKGVYEAMRNVALKVYNAINIKAVLKAFFIVLSKLKPDLIGGVLLDNGFHFEN